MNPDPYRGFFGADANSYAKDVQDYIAYGTSGKVAGFIAETIQVCVNIINLSCSIFKVVIKMAYFFI
jgi:alanine-glyoxylate transaminase/(R)-3-amino-2-methylpropionate-pyruvate transaminase